MGAPFLPERFQLALAYAIHLPDPMKLDSLDSSHVEALRLRVPELGDAIKKLFLNEPYPYLIRLRVDSLELYSRLAIDNSSDNAANGLVGYWRRSTGADW